MSIITNLEKIKKAAKGAENIRELTDAILIFLEKPFTEKYNKGIKNGESEGQAIVSALGATVVEYGLELNGVTGTALFAAELYYEKDEVEQWTDELYNDVDGAIDSLFTKKGINKEELNPEPTATPNPNKESYTIQKGDTVWDLAQKWDTTVSEIVETNSWLEGRSNDDQSWILIKPDEVINLSKDGDNISYNLPDNNITIETTKNSENFFESGISEILDNTAEVIIKIYDEVSNTTNTIEEYVIEAGSDIWDIVNEYGNSFADYAVDTIDSIENYVESLFDYSDSFDKVNKIETNNFNNLPEETQVQLTEQGIFPGGPGWNDFINDMIPYYENGGGGSSDSDGSDSDGSGDGSSGLDRDWEGFTDFFTGYIIHEGGYAPEMTYYGIQPSDEILVTYGASINSYGKLVAQMMKQEHENITEYEVPNTGHEITPQTIEYVRDWVDERFGIN